MVVDAFQLGHRIPPRQPVQLTIVSSLGSLLTSADSSGALSAMHRALGVGRNGEYGFRRKVLAILRPLHSRFTGTALPNLDSSTGHSFGLEFDDVMIKQIHGLHLTPPAACVCRDLTRR